MTFLEFVAEIASRSGIPLPPGWQTCTDEVTLAQKVLERLNEYFFQTYDGIGTTTFNDREYQYFSEFHKFWESHHVEILNVKIDKTQARQAAQALHAAFLKYGGEIFRVTLDTRGLSKEAIAQVRFFTANQDFRSPPEDQFAKYIDDDTFFDPKTVAEDAAGFLKFLGVTRLSQSDKRADFARNAAEFLLERGITAYGIAAHYGNDARKIREQFLRNVGMGYGRKKTDMFIRDMVVLGVWPRLANMEVVDVASDRNTMKLALRTRILQTDVPLLSSFLDIFGYQYSHIDQMSASAWRAVWEEWKDMEPQTAPVAPCMMDFLLYRIGREYCEDKVVEFICERGHRFFNFGAQIRRCRECRSAVTAMRRLLPCQVDCDELPRDEQGALRLDESNLLRTFDGVCIFESVCNPKSQDFRKLAPPKSISIVGKTSWTDSYAYKGEGGGGMMG